MTRPRGRPRRRWTHYPAAFTRIIEHFLHSQQTLEVPMPREQLYTYRTQFYRFFNAIREEYDYRESAVDAAASGLTDAYNVANNVLISTNNLNSSLVFTLGVLADTIKPASIEDAQAAAAYAERLKPGN